MTFPDHQSLDELKQSALFEVMGALDPHEAAQLDRDFRELPTSVQSELQRIQAEAASDPAYRGTEEPAPSLRARTVARVMTEVEQREGELAPIAQIGGPVRRRSGRTPVRSIDAAELMQQAMATATAKADAARFARSAYWWRAAAVALVAALIVTIYFERQANLWGQRVGESAMQRLSRSDMLDMLGHPGLRELCEQADVVRGMHAVASDGVGSATVLVDTRTSRAMLMTMGLRIGETYTLRVTREDGRKETIGTISPLESIAAVALTDGLGDVAAMAQMELVDSRGRVVLST
jgi:hypothetical protein